MADADDKPFACNEPGCTMKFTNEDHLMVHLQKHQMSLTLTPGGLKFPFQDQTPTPTKFLKNCEEIGLFSDINKNPFDDAFSRAVTDGPGKLKLPRTPSSESPLLLGVPHEHDTLNTPTPHVQNDTPLKKRYRRYESLEPAPDFGPLPGTLITADASSASSATDPKHSPEHANPTVLPTPTGHGSRTTEVKVQPKVISLKRPSELFGKEVKPLKKFSSNSFDEPSLSRKESVFGIKSESFDEYSEPVVKRIKAEVTSQLVSPSSSGNPSSQESLMTSEDARQANFDQDSSNHGYSQNTLVSPAGSVHSFSQDSILSPAGSVQHVTRDSILSPAGSAHGLTRDSLISPTGSVSHDRGLTPTGGGRSFPSDFQVQKGEYLEALRPESVQRIEVALEQEFGNTPLNLSAANSAPTAAVTARTQAAAPELPLLSSSAESPAGSSFLLKVMVQTPEGKYMPVHIPAAMATEAGRPPSAPKPEMVYSPAREEAVRVEGGTRALLPASVAVSSTTGSVSASSFAKQKLKAALLQNATTSSGNMGVMTEAVERVSAQGSPASFLTQAHRLSRDSSMSSFEVEYQDADSTDRPYSKSTELFGSPENETDGKRQKFLERNRAAAMRCRNKKKQWVNNLEKKAEELQSTNMRLQTEVTQLRSEMAQLKSLLLAHKDCPITQQQRQNGELALYMDDKLHSLNVTQSSSSSSVRNTQHKIAPLVSQAITLSQPKQLIAAAHVPSSGVQGQGEQWPPGHVVQTYEFVSAASTTGSAVESAFAIDLSKLEES